VTYQIDYGLSHRLRRETAISLPEVERRGQDFFRIFYGETAENVQSLLDKIYPDMGTQTMLFDLVIRVLEQPLHRVVQQHDCLWLCLRIYRHTKPIGDIIRLGRRAYRCGHSPPDCLASR
jgi:hypothetical protein